MAAERLTDQNADDAGRWSAASLGGIDLVKGTGRAFPAQRGGESVQLGRWQAAQCGLGLCQGVVWVLAAEQPGQQSPLSAQRSGRRICRRAIVVHGRHVPKRPWFTEGVVNSHGVRMRKKQ
jgi:hypothetical protein